MQHTPQQIYTNTHTQTDDTSAIYQIKQLLFINHFEVIRDDH